MHGGDGDTSRLPEEDVVLTVMSALAGAGPRGLRAREHLVLGSCGCPGCGSDLVLDAAPGAGFAAVVRAFEDHWRLENASADTHLSVTNLEDEGQRLTVEPRRSGYVVPFEFARLDFVQHGHPVGDSVTVIGHEPGRSRRRTTCAERRASAAVAGLRRGTTYMAVLDELCRAVEQCGRPPTSSQVASRLGERGVRLSPRAVDHHVDYLFRRLFSEADAGSRRGARKAAIVAVVRQARSAAGLEGLA